MLKAHLERKLQAIKDECDRLAPMASKGVVSVHYVRQLLHDGSKIQRQLKELK